MQNAFSLGPVISIPMPDGSFSRFLVAMSSLMPEAMMTEFPMIRAFTAKGIDDPLVSAKLDYTQLGFHAMIIFPKGMFFIEPSIIGNVTDYICFDKKDCSHAQNFICENMEDIDMERIVNPNPNIILRSAGTTLKTYRLALACTGEYASVFGGTVSGAMSAIVTSVNRVDGIYQKDLSIRLTLISNNSSIVYTNSATDPYTNTDPSLLVSQNQTNITNVIGTANFDIGHVFGTSGGGLASLPAVCLAASKARGTSGVSSPFGDSFDLDFAAHEMGHQFGANHTFNGSASFCGLYRESLAAYEPGSGSTIMSYAGVCGSNNLQAHNDALFHTKSFDQIQDYITTGSGSLCPVSTSTGNTPPVVTVGSNYTIPINTSFILTGSATDANSDPITYLWEEYDLGPAGPPNSPSGNAPIFRDFTPVSVNYRVFPRMSDLVRNIQTLGEILPSYARSLNFRLTARDNRVGGGGVTYNDTPVTLTVANTTTPFKVTSPNTAVTWFTNSPQTITWDVSSTNVAPVNCANVNILLSVDSGYTYPYTLVSNTPNDGTQVVTIPNVISSIGRVKVESVGNVFFDISIDNPEQISVTVPAFATTGLITIVTPCGTITSAGNFSVTTNLVTLNLKLYLEGYYQLGNASLGLMNNDNVGGLLYLLGYSTNFNDVDTVIISAMNSVTHSIVDSKKGILKTNGTVHVTFGSSVLQGTVYYIKVNHRNAIETWSSVPVLLSNIYDFTSMQSKAYGNNMILTYDNIGWSFYSGDISDANTATLGVQDGVIESQDYSDMENAVSFTLTGYRVEDITGDGIVESSDYSIEEGNLYFTRSLVRP